MLKWFFTLIFLIMAATAGLCDVYEITFENGTMATAVFVSSAPDKATTFCVIENSEGNMTSGYYSNVATVRTVWVD